MSTYERNANRLTIGLFIALAGISIAGTIWLPNPIAIHYNLSGQPNRWGSPATLLILPFIGFFVIGILGAVGKAHPDFMNFPGPRTPENVVRQVQNTRQMLASLRVFITSLFLVLQCQAIWANLYHQDRLIGWTIPLLIALLLLIVGFFVRRAYKLIPRQ